MPRHTQVVIIGGGIVGCSTAYYLARRGIAVVLFEKGTVAGEQSSRNWGFVRQQGRDPAELPMMMESNAIWRRLEEELGIDLHWTQGGNLRLATSEDQLSNYRAWLEEARNFGLDTELLDEDQVRELLPGLSAPVIGGLYTASDGQANPALVAPALAHAAGKLGAHVISKCAVTRIETRSDKITAVETENGTTQCETVVCAAGAWSSRVTRPLGLRIPQLWLRNSVGYTGQAKPLTDCGVWMPGVAFRQGRDGGFLISRGGFFRHDLNLDSLRFRSDFWYCFSKYRQSTRLRVDQNFLKDITGELNDFTRNRVLDPAPVAGDLESALQCFKTSFQSYGDVEFDRTWAGYIDATPDMLPVIDRVHHPDGLVLATGFSGHGFGLGPAAGRVASELALGETPSLDLRAFRYSRFHEGEGVRPGNLL